MQLDDFLRTFFRRWYVTVGMIAFAVAGAYLYTSATGTNTAETVVNVPFSALTDWDTAVHSKALSVRVADRLDDGTNAEDLQDQYAGQFKTGTGRLVPLYGIRASDGDPDRALRIADLVATEAIKQYEENRRANLEYTLAAYGEQIAQAEAESEEARQDLNNFLAQNNAYSLLSRLSAQSDLVDSLEQQLEFQQGNDPASIPIEEDPALTAAKAELERLQNLQPEAAQLTTDVEFAEATVSRLEAEIESLQIAGPGFEATLSAAQDQLAQAQTRLDNAQAALASFNSENGVEDLTQATTAQQNLVNELLLAQIRNNGNAATIEGALAAAEANLIQMQALLPEYNSLVTAVSEAESLRAIREQQGAFLAQIPPTTDRIELVESASIVSGLWWNIIRYAVAVMFAIFLSLTAVYFLTFFERVPPTKEDYERELGAPVLARIPRA